ncbi:hypothetical protein [Lysinibacillus halotolerans]|uniref:Uncharacterized protein n=1 Tax=Lysinibacillus halotolerans TaxID=1368476 RepID=A0A3M8HAT5_9BACI|nr:hypothetical protein [Lysinibacillus halotolerans]RNC99553.1 hypothetical protein EC501_07335 [Lysinibacillus halotolerans]
MDFFSKDQSFHTSSKYEPIYQFFNTKYKIGYKDLFLVCAAIGAKNDKRTQPLDQKGREFRSSFFSDKERKLVYSIILNDEEKGKNLESFSNSEFPKVARKLLQEYAEGGMDLLIEKVFKEKWNGHSLDDDHDRYEIDLLKYILADYKEVPF